MLKFGQELQTYPIMPSRVINNLTIADSCGCGGSSIYAKEGTSSFQNLQVFFDSAKKSINNTEVKSMLDLFLKKLT